VELGSQPKASSGYVRSAVTRKTNPQLCSRRYGAILKPETRSLWAHYAVHIKYGHETQKSFYITTCCHISDVGTNDENSCRNRKNTPLDGSAVAEIRTKTKLPSTVEGEE